MSLVKDLEQGSPVVWMFTGQGAQYFQMGVELYRTHEVFRLWMDKLDRIATQYVGQSIVDLLYDSRQSKSDPFDQTLYTHPALFMTQYALAKTLLAENFPSPDYLFGTSLGEFVATAISEVTDVEKMLFDIIKQARLFDVHCSGGGMLMVIDDVESFYRNPVYAHDCELSGVNFDRCFVISGAKYNIQQIAEQLKQLDITHQILPVSVAFHSSKVDIAETAFHQLFAESFINKAKIPIISCMQQGLNGAERFSSAYWWQVIRQPIEFRQAINKFHQQNPQAFYLDLGPSGNMATFTKYNLSTNCHHKIVPVMTPFGTDLAMLHEIRDRLYLS